MSKVLVVDDETPVLELERQGFAEHRWDVLVATSGEEALSLVGEHRPDLMILDLSLPGIQGLDILTAVRVSEDPIDVVVVTGNEDRAMMQAAIKLGVLKYLIKPYVLDELEKIAVEYKKKS